MDNTARMPSLLEVVVGAEGGFVGAADVLDEMIRTGSAAAVVRGTGGGVVLDAALPTGTAPATTDDIRHASGGGRAMRWNNNTSGFVLRRMAQLVGDDSRPDKVFKDKDVNHVGDVVYKGYKPGVYKHWADCNAQVAGFKKNCY